MTEDQQSILSALYKIEAIRLQRGEYAGWTTPFEVANALDVSHPRLGEEDWVRDVLEQLWVSRKVMQIPDVVGPHELLEFELESHDSYDGAPSKMPLESNDCRGPESYPNERAARYAKTNAVRFRSRVAEIARLLSLNFQRFRMTPSTGLLRYEMRPQTRPEYGIPIEESSKRLQAEILAGHLTLQANLGFSQEWLLDSNVDRSKLAKAIDGVLSTLAEDFGQRNQPRNLATFQERSIVATLCGLYSAAYSNEHKAHIVTAGVGSGKSFAFQLGALIHVAYKAMSGERKIQVLFLYPRVVLAANQFQDLYRLVKQVGLKIGVHLDDPILDAGGQLAASPSGETAVRGQLFTALQEAYQGDRQILISNLDTLANRLIHPEASSGLTKDLDLVVLDEVHLLSGLYGAHAKMLLKRLQLLRAMWRLRDKLPVEPFGQLLEKKKTVFAPYVVGASATISEPRHHLGRILDTEAGRVLHLEVGQTQQMGWVHHIFLRQRPEASSMTAATNAVSCLIHNRRNGLYHEYYQGVGDRKNVALDDISNPAEPSATTERRDSKHIHKTLGFCDSLDGVNRWADLIADNENSKAGSMTSSPSPARGAVPYFVRFQEPLWRVVHHETFGASPTQWQVRLWDHYGKLCRDCKRGIRRRIPRLPEGLSAGQRKRVEELWTFTPLNKSSYLSQLGVDDEFLQASWFTPVLEAGRADEIGNLDECGFLRSGLCWWWSSDHLGSNHPTPATGANPVNGYKKPLPHPQEKYIPLNAVRLRSFTSKVSFDVGQSINDVFRGDANSIFRDRSFVRGVQENCSLVIGSPRIEVGIDLSRATEGITFRAMRDPASLQQKVGRIGRELLSDGLIVHLVTENIRDNFYFRNPRIALDPEYLQPIPLHENNQVIARNHYFMAIVDFLCLQGGGDATGRISDDGDRIDLINDHKYQGESFANWDRKVIAIYNFLFGSHARRAENLQNLRIYLEMLGASGDELSLTDTPTLGPGDAPGSDNIGAIEMFRHEFGPNFLQTPLSVAGGTMTLAQICATKWPLPAVPRLSGLPRHEEFLKTYPKEEAQKNRSYLWQILTLPLFRRGIPERGIPGNQPYLWTPNFYEAVGKEYVRVFEEIDGRLTEQDSEPVGLALALLAPGTVTYRYSPSPRKVPVSRFGAQGLVARLPFVEAAKLDVLDSSYFAASSCAELSQDDLPAEFPWSGENVPVYTPRQIGLILSSSGPLVTPDGLLADDDSRPLTTKPTIPVATPPRCFSLRWYRIDASQTELPRPSCRFQSQFKAAKGHLPLPSLPLPEVFRVFSCIDYDAHLKVTDFVWGLDRQFMSRSVEPARIVYCDADPARLRPIALGHHYETMGLRFQVDLRAGSPASGFFEELWSNWRSGPHQALLTHVLHSFLAEKAVNPLQAGSPPWMRPSRPSTFSVRNLKTIVWFHLLESWHPSVPGQMAPSSPFVPTFEDLVGCFTPGHESFISETRFQQLCLWIAEVQNPASINDRTKSLKSSYSNFQSACSNVNFLTKDFFRTTAEELLLNSLSIVMHASALRLTGAEASDLAYFYKRNNDGMAEISLFDSDEFGNGTADLLRDTLHVSAIERILVSKQLALGANPDPLPSVDYASCLEDGLQECTSSQAAQLAFHDLTADDTCLRDLEGARAGEVQIGGPLFAFLRKELGLVSIDQVIPFQACPEFLAFLGRYPHHREALVPSLSYPTFQALESAMGFCVDGCIACVLAPEQNIHGVLSARETVSKLILDAFYREIICMSGSARARICYPGTDVGRTEMWPKLALTVAAAVGQSPPDSAPMVVELSSPGGPVQLSVLPATTAGNWNRVFRPDWNPAPIPGRRVRPRMLI